MLKNNDNHYNAIEKVLLILSHFAIDNKPISSIDLSDQLQLNKTTTSRIVNTLKKENFLEQNSLTKKYSLGPMATKIGKSIIQSLDGQATIISQSFCDGLRDEVGETVNLEVLSGNKIYLAYASRGPNALSVVVNVGDRVYPHIHAGAKCIAAYTHPRLVENWIQSSLLNYLPKPHLDIVQLRNEFKTILSTGISIDDGQDDANIYAIAAPVFNENCRAIASVVIVAPYIRKNNIKTPKCIKSLKESASLISERFFCPDKYDQICNMYLEDIELKAD